MLSNVSGNFPTLGLRWEDVFGGASCGAFRMESSMSQRRVTLSSLLSLICIATLNIGVLAQNKSNRVAGGF
jgi:hypothetical protein